MDSPRLAALHSVEFLGFYLPALMLWAGGAFVGFVVLRWLFERSGLYRFVWHRPLFNVALYVLLLGGLVYLGKLPWF